MHNEILKIFIAGSKQLGEQRNALRAVLMRQQVLFNVMVEAKTFEDFSDSLTDTTGGRQSEYEKYIKEQADIVAFIYDGKVGEITKKEFDVAYENFKSHKHPEIYVYCKNESSDTEDIQTLKLTLNKLGQYYTAYNDTDSLARLFEKSMTEYLVNSHFTKKRISPEEKIAFDLACQRVSNTMISCLSTVDEFGCVLNDVSSSWNKFMQQAKEAVSQEGLIVAETALLEDLHHQLSEIKRIATIYPLEKVVLEPKDLEILASHIKSVSELTCLPDMYQTYFDDVIKPFNAIENFLTDTTSQSLHSRMIHLHFASFKYMANGFFYSIIQYLSQFPKEYQKNVKEMLLLWQTYPTNVSLTHTIEEYERFTKHEFDAAEKLVIEMKALLAVKDNELDNLKNQLDKMVVMQNCKKKSLLSKIYLRIKEILG